MEDLQTTIAVAVVVAFIAMLIAGATNKIVIYFDGGDFLVSFMPWGSLLIGMILLNIYQHEGDVDFDALSGVQSFIWYASLLSSAVFFAWSMKLSITHNRSVVLGLIVGLFKILSAFLGILVLVGQVGRMFSDESSTKDALLAMLVFGVFIWLGKKLINGEQVYIAKGWALPESEDAITT